MKKVYIFGRGLGLPYVKRCIRNDVDIIGYIDNYAIEEMTEDGVPVIGQEDIDENDSYIIITLIQYEEIRSSLIETNVGRDRIICFFDINDAEKEEFYEIVDANSWKTELMWKNMREVVQPTINNLTYELHADLMREKKEIPFVMTADETIDIVINKRKSLVRYGDGEFEMMCDRHRLRYQDVSKNLSDRLIDIMRSDDDRVLIAIADNYGELDKYTDNAANGIRYYLQPSIRREHMQILDSDKCYGNAYLSRPYLIYRDKCHEVIERKFNHLKEIWRDWDVLVVEGEHTRFGVGNDLLDGSNSVKRILVPDKNAFDCYDEIFEEVKKYADGRLILSIIGPTATILSYDLAMLNHWAIDIGQVDTEYEWFLMGTEERRDVPYKTVSEYADKNVFDELPDDMNIKYMSEIIARVGLER